MLVILNDNGKIIELTLTSPFTYMLLGLLFYTIAMSTTLVPDGKIPCFISFIAGSILLVTAFLLYLFQSNNLIQFWFIIGIIISVSIYRIILFSINKTGKN